MKGHEDLIGKTITGVMAVPTEEDGPLKIWMLQFSDGTHVEFVSPGARRTLDRLAKRSRGTQSGRRNNRRSAVKDSLQLALNVA